MAQREGGVVHGAIRSRPFTPFHTIADFLDPSLHDELHDYVLSNAASFKPVGVHVDGVTNVDEGKR